MSNDRARVLVFGGSGNFGARIVRDLRQERGVEVLVAGRSRSSDVDHVGQRFETLDIMQSDLAERLRALAPRLVIHCVGPFQGQDYRIVRAALGAGAHYLDLADGRAFVADFAAANDALARSTSRTAISGASTLPGLSSAVVERLGGNMEMIESVHIAIAPGQRAPRGIATLQAVFSYLGRPVKVLERGSWRRRFGWMGLRRIRFAFGMRFGAVCDVPDLELLPLRYPTLRTVRFHAALEHATQHGALWLLAALRRCGVPLRVDCWAKQLHSSAAWFDRFSGPMGGMRVRLEGQRDDGKRVVRNWQLSVPATNGPEIPCMAATLLARRMLRGDEFEPGATTCMGRLSLDDFAHEFARWKIDTTIEERLA